MKCPFCGSEETKVIDSRNYQDGMSIKRRRECLKCKKRFTTYEKLEEVHLYVNKKSGGREYFNREKVLRGLKLSTIKRNVDIKKIEKLIDELEYVIQSKENNEIGSEELGDLILEKLLLIDEVAYVRFASVYKDFKDIKSFIEVVEQVNKRGEK